MPMVFFSNSPLEKPLAEEASGGDVGVEEVGELDDEVTDDLDAATEDSPAEESNFSELDEDNVEAEEDDVDEW